MNTQGMPVGARIEIFRKFMNDNGNLIAQHLIDRLEPVDPDKFRLPNKEGN